MSVHAVYTQAYTKRTNKKKLFYMHKQGAQRIYAFDTNMHKQTEFQS